MRIFLKTASSELDVERTISFAELALQPGSKIKKVMVDRPDRSSKVYEGIRKGDDIAICDVSELSLLKSWLMERLLPSAAERAYARLKNSAGEAYTERAIGCWETYKTAAVAYGLTLLRLERQTTAR